MNEAAGRPRGIQARDAANTVLDIGITDQTLAKLRGGTQDLFLFPLYGPVITQNHVHINARMVTERLAAE